MVNKNNNDTWEFFRDQLPVGHVKERSGIVREDGEVETS